MTSTSDLVQRILSERRGVIVPLALVALVNLGFYALAVYPLSLKVSASENRAVAARTQLAVADREDKDVRATLRLTEQASKDLSRKRTSIWRRWRGSTTWRFRGAAIVWTRATKGASNV